MSKRLVGGDYLLDLSSIEIEESVDGTTKTNITDADVLAQLTNLKKYVPNPQMAKPVWVKLKNGENDELVVARGTFANVDTGEFEICVQLNGYKLIISIEFTQALNEDNEPIDDWYIDTNDAKYLFTSDAQNIGAITSSGDLKSVKADEIIENMIGYSAVIPTQENLTIENVYTSVVKNGNKLTFVSALNITRTDNITSSVDVVWFGVPNDIFSKLYPTSIGSYTMLAYTNSNFIASDDSVVNLSLMIEKRNDGNNILCYIQGGTIGNLPLNKSVYVRFEQTFLLSDNLISNE